MVARVTAMSFSRAFAVALCIFTALVARAHAAIHSPEGAPLTSLRRLLGKSHYSTNEEVVLYANKVGPFHNPSEVRGRCVRRLV